MNPDQHDLTKLFAENFHLSVPDRNLLYNGTIYGSELVDAISEIVEQKGKFPPKWDLNSPFDGWLIEKINDKVYRLTWQAEIGVCRFQIVSQKDFTDIKNASKELAEKFFGSSFDGIAIDWAK